MDDYLLLIRGINVGGKNKVPMKELKACLENLGFQAVSTYIASGNAFVRSDQPPAEVRAAVEKALPGSFRLDSDLLKVLVLTDEQLRAVVANKPVGFGEQPEKYHSDAIFLIDIDADEAMAVFDPRPGVDEVWPGAGVIYSQRLSARRTQSRLSRIAGTPPYKSMTIRSWNTTTKLLDLLDARGTPST